MNPEKNINENEQLEREEQSIDEPVNIFEQGESEPYKTVAEMTNEEIDEIAPVE